MNLLTTAAILLLAVLSSTYASTPAYAHSNVHLRKHTIHVGPRSRIHSLLSNGSSIPAGGSVWPTAIYWTMVQVGTPPVDFPVCIDSGSGDLDISGKGCDGCPTKAPNNAYDPAASSSAKKQLFPFSNSYQTCDLKNPTAVCTISGPTYKDQVSLAGFGPVEVTIGDIQKQTANFDQFHEIGGVMGFTQGGKKDVFASGGGKQVRQCMGNLHGGGPKSNGTRPLVASMNVYQTVALRTSLTWDTASTLSKSIL